MTFGNTFTEVPRPSRRFPRCLGAPAEWLRNGCDENRADAYSSMPERGGCMRWLAGLIVAMLGIVGALMFVSGLADTHLGLMLAGGAMAAGAWGLFRLFFEHEYE